MNTLNTMPQTTSYGNTGIGGKYLNPVSIQGVFIVPRTFVLTAAQLATPATVIAALVAASQADNPLQRVFPLYNPVGLTDSSEAVVKEKLPSGSDITVRFGTYTHGWRVRKGGLSLLRRLQLFNPFPDNISIMWLDANGFLLGTAMADSTGAAGLGGAPIEDFFADKWRFNDFTKTTELMVYYNLFPQYINALLAYTPLGTTVNYATTIFGLQDVNIQLVSSVTPVAGTYPVKVFTTEPAADITSLFNAALSIDTMWSVVNSVTGATIPITAATYNAAGQYISLVCTVTAPPYPTVGNVTISLVGPTELTAGTPPLPGYECSGPLSTPISA